MKSFKGFDFLIYSTIFFLSLGIAQGSDSNDRQEKSITFEDLETQIEEIQNGLQPMDVVIRGSDLKEGKGEVFIFEELQTPTEEIQNCFQSRNTESGGHQDKLALHISKLIDQMLNPKRNEEILEPSVKTPEHILETLKLEVQTIEQIYKVAKEMEQSALKWEKTIEQKYKQEELTQKLSLKQAEEHHKEKAINEKDLSQPYTYEGCLPHKDQKEALEEQININKAYEFFNGILERERLGRLVKTETLKTELEFMQQLQQREKSSLASKIKHLNGFSTLLHLIPQQTLIEIIPELQLIEKYQKHYIRGQQILGEIISIWQEKIRLTGN